MSSKNQKLTLAGIIVVAILEATPAHAQILIFNSGTPADNVAVRQSWLNAMGITTPQHLVNFETGFVNGQNISGVPGLFPAGLVIRDTSGPNQVIIRSGNNIINGSNPVGVFSATHSEQAFLVLDFTTNPVDYVAFQDIDHSGTTGIVTFVDSTTASISFETTAGMDDSAEFFGIFRNDRPQIRFVQLDATGDGLWGIDTIEYGVIPEPSTLTMLALGALCMIGHKWRQRRQAMRALHFESQE